jgi:hypothetical protein
LMKSFSRHTIKSFLWFPQNWHTAI